MVKIINHSLIAQTNPAMVMAHKYWARKPLNVIRKYVECYSKEGDIVLDNFTGSGITNIASLQLKRKTIGLDINPIAIFISKMSSNHINISQLKKEFQELSTKCKDKINSLYEIDCPNCKNNAIISHIIIEKEYEINQTGKNYFKNTQNELHKQILKLLFKKHFYTQIKNILDIPSTNLTKNLNNLYDEGYINEIEIEREYKVKCSCKTKTFYPINSIIEKRLKLNFEKIPFKWYPKNKLFHNSRICAYSDMKICDLFTQRNLKGLSILLDEIENISNKEIREMLRFTFSSALPQSSKFVWMYEDVNRKNDVGGWTLHSFTIPARHYEINIWNCFEERFNKVIRAKEQANYEIPISEEIPFEDFSKYKKAIKGIPNNNPEKLKYFTNLFSKYNLLLTYSALKLEFIPDNSIDFIFTDPPYGNSIPYLELSMVFNSWLNFNQKYTEFAPNYEEEIIISESDERIGKDDVGYKKLLEEAFKEAHRVLKPNKYLVLTFHNENLETWNALITSAQETEFEYIDDFYQKDARASAKSGLASSGSLVGDMIVIFKKSSNKRKIQTEDGENIEKLIYKEAELMMAERDGKIKKNILLTGILHLLLRKELTKRIEHPENFINKTLAKKFDKINNEIWQLREPPKMRIIPLKDRIKTIILGKISKRGGTTFSEIMSALLSKLKNGHHPENLDVMNILKEIGENKEDKWFLKRQSELFSKKVISIKEELKKKKLEKQIQEHNECIEILAKIGEIINLKKEIGKRELNQDDILKKYHDFMDKTGIDIDALNVIKQIDLIYFEKNKLDKSVIKACFEVEFETLRTQKFLQRFRELRNATPNNKIPLFIIIHAYQEKYTKKLLLKEINQEFEIHYIMDDDLFNFYNKIINKKIENPTLESLLKISKKAEIQEKLEIIP